MYTIHTPTPNHALGIANCIQLSFGESASVENIARIIEEKQHTTYISLSPAGQVAGFVDTFQTKAQDNTSRHEIDLLAVHPDHRRNGIARKLVQASLRASNSDMSRALVASDNKPMQNNLHKLGFQQSKLHALYTASTSATLVATSTDAHLIPVDTFTYNGIWLEGNITPQAINAALYQRTQQQRDVVGVVIATDNIDAINNLQIAKFERINTYHWWHIQTKSINRVESKTQ
ncbi:MAG: N-acetyltransferase [Chloroflexota bacterium]